MGIIITTLCIIAVIGIGIGSKALVDRAAREGTDFGFFFLVVVLLQQAATCVLIVLYYRGVL